MLRKLSAVGAILTLLGLLAGCSSPNADDEATRNYKGAGAVKAGAPGAAPGIQPMQKK